MPDTYSENMGGEKLLFLFGDGGSPTEEFAASCSINTSSTLNLSSEVFQGAKANCTDPSKPSITTRRVKSLDVKFSGEGAADKASHKALIDLWKAGEPFNGKAVQDVGSGGGWTIEGPWIVESIDLTGPHREDQTFAISIAIAGEFDLEAA